MTKAQFEEARARRLKGEAVSSIALDYGISEPSLRQRFSRAGVVLDRTDRGLDATYYHEQGLSTAQIAELMGVTGRAVNAMLLRRGIRRRSPFTAADRKKIAKWVAQGMSYGAIARRLGRHPATISNLVKRGRL